MDRRAFLRRSSIALAGGLVLGDAALEAFERLTHRKVFALGGLPESPIGISGMERMAREFSATYYYGVSTSTYPVWASYGPEASKMEAAHVARIRALPYRRLM